MSKIKKTIFLIFFAIILINYAYAETCANFEVGVYDVEKNESCYTFFNVIFKDPGCEENCFSNVSNFVVMQGDKVISNISDITTTFVALNFRRPSCVDDVSLKMYSTNNQLICTKQFSLITRYNEIKKESIAMNSSKPINTINQITTNPPTQEINKPAQGGASGGRGGNEANQKPSQFKKNETTLSNTSFESNGEVKPTLLRNGSNNLDVMGDLENRIFENTLPKTGDNTEDKGFFSFIKNKILSLFHFLFN